MDARWVRRVPLLAALVLGTAGQTTAMAQAVGVECWGMHFEISNPRPGSTVLAGRYTVQGVADDSRAADGSPGIDSVDLFLGSRDRGGMIVGHAIPSTNGPWEGDSFETTITLPGTPVAQELFGYAHSSVTGDVSVVSVPIAVGVDVSRAGDVQSRTPVTECRTGTLDTGAPAEAAPQEVAAPADVPDEGEGQEAPQAQPADVGSSLYLNIANPAPGDSVHVGAMDVQGIAFDSASGGGPGIDHIDVFLDNRDRGGVLVGRGSMGAAGAQPDDPSLYGAGWAARVVIPTKMVGPHILFFYALSSVSGEEIKVGMPIQVVR
jgi:hypothetical protein